MHVMHGQKPGAHCPRPAEMRRRYLLGVKWSQVQILSARPENMQVRSGFRTEERPQPLAIRLPVGQECPKAMYQAMASFAHWQVESAQLDHCEDRWTSSRSLRETRSSIASEPPGAHGSPARRRLVLLRHRLDEAEHPRARLSRHRWAGYQVRSHAFPSRETARGGLRGLGGHWPRIRPRARSGLWLKLLVVVALRVGNRLCISVARDGRSQLNFGRAQRNCVSSYLPGWGYEPSRSLIVHVRSQTPNCPQRRAQPYL